MPDFEPNEYLFRTHADKGKDRWEIYAWALRDVMARTGNFETSDINLRLKIAYQDYMNHNSDTHNIEGKSLLKDQKEQFPTNDIETERS